MIRDLSQMRKYGCLERSVSGLRHSKCKDPKASTYLPGSRDGEEACVTGAEGDLKSRRSEGQPRKITPQPLSRDA